MDLQDPSIQEVDYDTDSTPPTSAKGVDASIFHSLDGAVASRRSAGIAAGGEPPLSGSPPRRGVFGDRAKQSAAAEGRPVAKYPDEYALHSSSGSNSNSSSSLVKKAGLESDKAQRNSTGSVTYHTYNFSTEKNKKLLSSASKISASVRPSPLRTSSDDPYLGMRGEEDAGKSPSYNRAAVYAGTGVGVDVNAASFVNEKMLRKLIRKQDKMQKEMDKLRLENAALKSTVEPYMKVIGLLRHSSAFVSEEYCPEDYDTSTIGKLALQNYNHSLTSAVRAHIDRTHSQRTGTSAADNESKYSDDTLSPTDSTVLLPELVVRTSKAKDISQISHKQRRNSGVGRSLSYSRSTSGANLVHETDEEYFTREESKYNGTRVFESVFRPALSQLLRRVSDRRMASLENADTPPASTTNRQGSVSSQLLRDEVKADDEFKKLEDLDAIASVLFAAMSALDAFHETDDELVAEKPSVANKVKGGKPFLNIHTGKREYDTVGSANSGDEQAKYPASGQLSAELLAILTGYLCEELDGNL